ncbi:MAG: PRC-barrel domain-containing protein [Candidatus Thermoplasmatota archaeon]|nr:PRC-barrel domain-containing protein [Candidatus Thermoplasmatota archaeon]
MKDIMTHLSELKKKDVVSADGKIIGTVNSAIITGKMEISGLVIKMSKAAIEAIGKKKPLFSSLLMDVNVDEIKGIQDTIVLNHLWKDISEHLLPHNTKFDAERLISMEVLGTGGKIVGTVEDINIDTQNWQLPSLIIKIKKDALETIKMDNCLLCGNRLHISMQHITDVGDYVMLEVTADNIGKILDITPIKKG